MRHGFLRGTALRVNGLRLARGEGRFHDRTGHAPARGRSAGGGYPDRTFEGTIEQVIPAVDPATDPPTVFVLKDGRARRVPVELRLRDEPIVTVTLRGAGERAGGDPGRRRRRRAGGAARDVTG
jgi:hypothetical protein